MAMCFDVPGSPQTSTSKPAGSCPMQIKKSTRGGVDVPVNSPNSVGQVFGNHLSSQDCALTWKHKDRDEILNNNRKSPINFAGCMCKSLMVRVLCRAQGCRIVAEAMLSESNMTLNRVISGSVSL